MVIILLLRNSYKIQLSISYIKDKNDFCWIGLYNSFKFKTLILSTYLHDAKHAQKLCRLMGRKERE